MKGLLIKLKYLIKNEEGSALIITALGMMVFLGFVALVTDVGLLYLNKTKITNAIDAAALAGSQELPFSSSAAIDVAKEYAEKNGINTDEIEVEISNNNSQISITTSKKVELIFAKILGISEGTVKAKSAAKVGAVTKVVGAAPLAIEEQNFLPGQLYSLKEGHGSYGWFGPITLGGSGAGSYEENLRYGYKNELKVGDIIDTETGNMSGPTQSAILDRFNQDNHYPKCTWKDYIRGCSRILIIPIIKPPQDSGQIKQVEVRGFGAFLVDAVPDDGNESSIEGYFIKTILPGDIDFNITNYGVSGVKLTE